MHIVPLIVGARLLEAAGEYGSKVAFAGAVPVLLSACEVGAVGADVGVEIQGDALTLEPRDQLRIGEIERRSLPRIPHQHLCLLGMRQMALSKSR